MIVLEGILVMALGAAAVWAVQFVQRYRAERKRNEEWLAEYRSGKADERSLQEFDALLRGESLTHDLTPEQAADMSIKLGVRIIADTDEFRDKLAEVRKYLCEYGPLGETNIHYTGRMPGETP